MPYIARRSSTGRWTLHVRKEGKNPSHCHGPIVIGMKEYNLRSLNRRVGSTAAREIQPSRRCCRAATLDWCRSSSQSNNAAILKTASEYVSELPRPVWTRPSSCYTALELDSSAQFSDKFRPPDTTYEGNISTSPHCKRCSETPVNKLPEKKNVQAKCLVLGERSATGQCRDGREIRLLFVHCVYLHIQDTAMTSHTRKTTA